MQGSPSAPVPPASPLEVKDDHLEDLSEDEGSVVDLEDSDLQEEDDFFDEDEDGDYSDVEFEGDLDSHGRFVPTRALGRQPASATAAPSSSPALEPFRSMGPSTPTLSMPALRFLCERTSSPINYMLLALHNLFTKRILSWESLQTLGSTPNTSSVSEPSQPHLSLLCFRLPEAYVLYECRCDSLADLLCLRSLQTWAPRLTQSDMDRACEAEISCLRVLRELGLCPSL